MVLSSCATPNPKKQKKHWDKFVYYGGKIDSAERIIRVTNTIKGKDGKDSLIYIDVPVKCPEPKIDYKDRWYIRRLDKAEKDSLVKLYNHREKMSKIRASAVEDSLKKVIQLERAKSKTVKSEYSWIGKIIWSLVLVLLIIIALKWRRS
jgi:hypothetical protein